MKDTSTAAAFAGFPGDTAARYDQFSGPLKATCYNFLYKEFSGFSN